MPLKGEAKREYQRLWVQRRRRSLRLGKGIPKGKGVEPVEPVEPDVEPPRRGRVVEPRTNPYSSRGAQAALGYAAYVNARDNILAEVVNTVDGTLSWGVVPSPLVGRMEALEGLFLVAQQRIMALEAAQVLREAQERYRYADATLDDHMREREEER